METYHRRPPRPQLRIRLRPDVPRTPMFPYHVNDPLVPVLPSFTFTSTTGPSPRRSPRHSSLRPPDIHELRIPQCFRGTARVEGGDIVRKGKHPDVLIRVPRDDHRRFRVPSLLVVEQPSALQLG